MISIVITIVLGILFCIVLKTITATKNTNLFCYNYVPSKFADYELSIDKLHFQMPKEKP